jgi:hypothetical protein
MPRKLKNGQLVLAASQPLGEPKHVGPPSDAKVAERQINPVRSDPVERRNVLRTGLETPAEAWLLRLVSLSTCGARVISPGPQKGQ